MSLARVVAANTAVQAMGKVASTILGIVIVALMTRLLGTAGFGAYSTANAFLQVFAILVDLGLNVMIVQMLGERAGDTAHENRVVSAIFSLRFWSALILLTVAPFIALLVPVYAPETKIAMFAIWGSFFFTVLGQIVTGVQQRHLKMHVVAAAEVLGRVVLLVGLLIAIQFGWGLVPVVLLVSLSGFANFILNFVIAKRYARFSIKPDWPFWGTILKRSWPIATTIVISLLYFKSDTLILSFVRSESEVGVYSAAYRVLEILATFPYMFAGVLMPLIANAWAKGERDRFASMIRRSFDAFALIVIPLVVGTQLVATKGMTLVATADFAESGGILQILVVAVGFIYFGAIFGYAVVAVGKQRAMIPVYAVVTAIVLALYWVLIPRYGMWAAAWLTLLSEALIAMASTVVTLSTARMRLSFVTFGKALLSAAFMFAAAYPFRSNVLLTMAVAMIVYGAAVFATGAVTKEMLRNLLLARNGTSGETMG